MPKRLYASFAGFLRVAVAIVLCLSSTPVGMAQPASFAQGMVASGATSRPQPVSGIGLAASGQESEMGIDSLPVRLIASAVVVITATKRDAILLDGDGDGKIGVGDALRYTVAIRNNGDLNAASVVFSDTLPATTALSGTLSTTPVALGDVYSATGNVSISVPAGPGVLANDFGIPAPGVVASSGASARGGSYAIDADGSFTYDPPAGYEGADTFNYTAVNASGSATATVTINISGMIWFINNNPVACASACDGRLSRPFTTLSAFASVNNGTTNNPAASDSIFLYESSANYAGPVTLLNGQKLIGQDATTSLAAITGLTLPPYNAFLPTVNSGNGTTVNITSSGNGVNLAANNGLYGFMVGSATGTAISGSNFGTLTVASVAINNTAGAALNLSNGTGSMSFSSVTSSGGVNNVKLASVNGTVNLGGGSLSGSSGNAFEVSGGSGNISYAGGITNASGRVVSVSGITGGAVALSGNLTETGTGIYVSGNTGGTVTFSGSAKTLSTGSSNAVTLSGNAGATINFASGGLNITTSSGQGMAVSGGGTLNVTGLNNTITTTAGIALSMANTTIGSSGVVFRRISASGGQNGIVLNSTGSSGSFVVAGDGSLSNNFSGGTIQNTTGDGVLLTNTNSVTLRSMRILNPGGDGIESSGSANITLSGTTIDLASISGSSESGHGGLRATNLGGINRIDSGSQIKNIKRQGSGNSGIVVVNTNTNMTSLTVVDSTFSNDLPNTNGEAFVALSAQGSSNMKIEVVDSTFAGMFGSAIVSNAGDNTGSTATVVTKILNSYFQNAADSGANNVEVNALNNGTADFTIQGNTLANVGKPSFPGAAIKVTSFDNGSLDGVVTSNSIANIPGYRGIEVESGNTGGSQTVAVSDNSVSGTGGEGLYVRAWHSTPDMNVTMNYNTFGTGVQPVGTTDKDGIYVSAEDGARMAVWMEGNQVLISSPGASSQAADLRIGINRDGSEAPVMSTTVRSNVFTNTVSSSRAFTGTTFNTSSTMCLDLRTNTAASGGLFNLVNSAGNSFLLNSAGNIGIVSQTGAFGATSTCPAPKAPSPSALLSADTTSSTTIESVDLDDPSDAEVKTALVGSSGSADLAGTAQIANIRPSQALAESSLVGVGPFTLAPGKAITITFDVTMTSAAPSGVSQISNQGQVSGSNFATVLTDDPDTAAPNDPTATPVEDWWRVFLPLIMRDVQ